MPELNVDDDKVAESLGLIIGHLYEQIVKLNQTLEKVADALEAIESRLSYATTLDNTD